MVGEINEVLEERGRQAYPPGTVPKESIGKSAEHCRGEGDFRKAIGLLRRAGQRAEEYEANEVTPKIVEEVLAGEAHWPLGECHSRYPLEYKKDCSTAEPRYTNYQIGR